MGASEVCLLRYPALLLLVSALVLPDWVVWRDPRAIPVLGVLMTFSVLYLTRPWHRRMEVGRDGKAVEMHWRVFGVVPLARRRVSLEGRHLAVVTRNIVQSSSGVEASVLGCALGPLGWLVLLLGSGRKFSGTVLRVTDPAGETFDNLALLASPGVVGAFLDAVRGCCPDLVRTHSE